MYTLKGFIVIGTLADNSVGAVAPLGELSPRGYTYAKEKGQYTDPAYGDITLVSFKSDLDGSLIAVPSDYSQLSLQIAKWIYDQAENGQITDDRDQFITELTAAFNGDVTDWLVGEMKTNGTIWMPDSVAFDVAGTGEDNRVRLWFSNETFTNLYDEYEIVVVPPVENIDVLLSDYNSVEAAVNTPNQTDITNRIQLAREDYPETVLRTVAYEWVDAGNEAYVLQTYWNVLIYGGAGNNIDLIKQAIIEYILENSSSDEDAWKEVIPDLFTSTEFIIAPFWNDYAIPNMTVEAGIYSPSIQVNNIAPYAVYASEGYPSGHVNTVMTVSQTSYKSLAFVAIGGPDNRDGVVRFRDRFPDYTAIPTNSIDFNRMSPSTQDWILQLIEMIEIAEDMTEQSDIPIGMDRVTRGDKMYLSASFDNILYLVLSKQSGEAYVSG